MLGDWPEGAGSFRALLGLEGDPEEGLEAWSGEREDVGHGGGDMPALEDQGSSTLGPREEEEIGSMPLLVGASWGGPGVASLGVGTQGVGVGTPVLAASSLAAAGTDPVMRLDAASQYEAVEEYPLGFSPRGLAMFARDRPGASVSALLLMLRRLRPRGGESDWASVRLVLESVVEAERLMAQRLLNIVSMATCGESAISSDDACGRMLTMVYGVMDRPSDAEFPPLVTDSGVDPDPPAEPVVVPRHVSLAEALQMPPSALGIVDPPVYVDISSDSEYSLMGSSSEED
jgi:hypothetical protein